MDDKTTMAIKTLYSILGLEPQASYEDIEAAFTRLKLQYSRTVTDASEDARNRFQAIQQAYGTLRDPDTRKIYDQKISRAGIKSATTIAESEDRGWLTTRNIVVTGVIVILVSGMWWYHAREKARQEAEAVQRLLRIAEEEKARRAEIEAQQEARRQAAFEAQQEQQQINRERQFRNEAQQSARQVDANLRNAQQQSDAEKRREQAERDRIARQEQYARQQAERDAQARLQREKAQLRQICMDRYRRPDC